MKTRNWWIANSSSSSFIVAFDEMPKNEDELRHMMFGDKISHCDIWGEHSYPTQEIANVVWKEMYYAALGDESCIISEGKIEFDNILNIMCYGSINGQPEIPDEYWGERDRKKSDEIIRRYDLLVKEYNISLRDNLFALSDNLFHFEYSDGDSDFWSFMEHGGIFERLRHVRISKH